MNCPWLKPADQCRHRFNPDSAQRAVDILSQSPGTVLSKLLTGRDDEATWLVAMYIAEAALAGTLVTVGSIAPQHANTASITLTVLDKQVDALQTAMYSAPGGTGSPTAKAIIELAFVGIWTGSWLRTVSQPATQPASVANQLFRQYFRFMGEGVSSQSCAAKWSRHAASHGVDIPGLTALESWETLGVSAATFFLVAIQQALGFFGATYLPELVGFNWAWQAIDVGDERAANLDHERLANREAARRIMAEYLQEWSFDLEQAEAACTRVTRGALLAFALRKQQQEIIRPDKPEALDLRVATIFRRHYKYPGPQHGNVKVNGKLLTELFSAADFDAQAFARDFKRSHWARFNGTAPCRFWQAIRFGGPMFGVFSKEEADILDAWLTEQPRGEETDSSLLDKCSSPSFVHILARSPTNVLFEVSPTIMDDREWLYRLVNIECYPNLLKQVGVRASKALADATALNWNGALTRYTDATPFKWSRSALEQRVRGIYRDKLQAAYRPLTQIPSKEEVIFIQKTYALGNLIDGSWAHRIDPLTADCAGAWEMFAIYADEMGRGNLNKNHIALIYRVLDSMGIKLPHIASPMFRDQDELLDEFYPFAIFQLALSLQPQIHYAAILGYNLAIEMFGLGELRKHEIQKLRHWGFSILYEVTHLSIDNLSSGHARMSVDAIIRYMEKVERYVNAPAAEAVFAEIWSGYAAFAQFIETDKPMDVKQDEYLI